MKARGVAAHLTADGLRTPCVVENVSLGGVFLRTDRLLALGTQVLLHLVRPGWKKSLAVLALVSTRHDPLEAQLDHTLPGLGLQFVGLTGTSEQRLKDLLEGLGLPVEEVTTVPPPPPPAPARAAPAARPVAAGLARPSAPPAPPAQAGLARPLPPPAAAPQRPSRPPVAEADGGANALLMMQIKGLLAQLDEAHKELARRDLQIEELREELESAYEKLAGQSPGGS